MLNYNENKVAKGQALLIGAGRYGRAADQLSFRQKLERLSSLAEKNGRARTKAVHLSLNFDVGENLDKDTLLTIASRYMDGIGFGSQPYLVYQHFDAGHPHIHIATTNIKADGSRIDLHNLGKTKSEETRKAIEQEFNLVRAESKSLQPAQKIKPQELHYGQTDTKRAITNMVSELLRYNVTSLAEWNVLLRRYNLIADRGPEGSRMQAKNGLVYQLLNDRGEKTGVPIKASSIYGQPTLRNLHKQFKANQTRRGYLKAKLKLTLDQVMQEQLTQKQLIQQLKLQGIDAIFRENSKGNVFGLSFIDHRNRAVFKGSEIAERYSASKVFSRLTAEATPKPQPPKDKDYWFAENTPTDLLGILMPEQQLDEPVAFGFRKKKKKRRF